MRKKIVIRGVSMLIMLFVSLATFAQSKWVAPASASNVKNPLGGNNGSLKAGKLLYTSNCVPCHGEKGKGDGAAAASLSPKPADHSSAAVQSQTDGAIFYKLTEGKSPMPSYKTLLTDNQRWSLVNYIRTLKKK